MNGDGKKYLVMDGDVKRDGASPDFSQKEIVFTNSNHLSNQLFSLFPFVCYEMLRGTQKGLQFRLGASTEISVYRDLGTQIDTLGKGSQKKGEKWEEKN